MTLPPGIPCRRRSSPFSQNNTLRGRRIRCRVCKQEVLRLAAKRTRKKSKRRTKAQIAAQNQILAVLLCTIGLLFFFLAFVKGSEGWLSAHNVLLGIFGWSAFFIGPILIYISVMASFDRISDDLPIRASLTAVMLLWSREMLLVFGASENTIGFAMDYMSIYALGTLFVQLTLGMNAFITAQGFATVGMQTVFIGAVLNIVLDPVLIFGLGMGIRGAAVATVLSQGVSCVWVIRFLTGKKTILRLKKENFFPGAKLILPCIALGLATFTMQASESVISVCFNSSLLKYGGDLAVGAMTILSSVMQFALLPLQGIAQGSQPITSYNFGAGNVGRVRETFRRMLTACLCYSCGLWALIMLFPQAFASLFSSDAELIAFTAKALRVYCGALFLFGIQIACQITFVSIGNAPCSIFVAVLRKFILLIPLIYLLPHLLADQTMAVYAAEPGADAIAVTCTLLLFQWQFRKALRKLEKQTA